MRYTRVILALSATALSAAIPQPIANAAPYAEAAPAPIAIPSMSDGHQVTNPSFEASANFDLDALNAKGAGIAAEDDSYPVAGHSVGGNDGNAGANMGSSGQPSMKQDLDEIERMFGGNGVQKRDVSEGGDDGVTLAYDDGGEQDLGKRELEKRATLSAYLIYCLQHPKKCRAVKVKGR